MGGFHPMAMAYLKNFHQRADCTLTPSQDMVERLSNNGFQNVRLLGRGVDTELFAPGKRCESLRASWGARAATPVAVMVGRVAPEKNFDLAMKTFEQMRQVFPDVRCVVIGDGPLREKLALKFPWVYFSGVQSGEELAKHYASADVLVFPSETETFGNVLLEAMASGLATVSYRLRRLGAARAGRRKRTQGGQGRLRGIHPPRGGRAFIADGRQASGGCPGNSGIPGMGPSGGGIRAQTR